MTDGAKATLRIELTYEEPKVAVTEYVVRRYPQALMNGRVVFSALDKDAEFEAEVSAEFIGTFRIPKGGHA